MKGVFLNRLSFLENPMKKRILICSLLALAFLILGTAVYCFNLVNDISTKLEGFSEKIGELRQDQGYLEEGSVVNRNDLRDYILFSTEPKGFKEWLKVYDKKWEPFTQGEELLYIRVTFLYLQSQKISVNYLIVTNRNYLLGKFLLFSGRVLLEWKI